MIRQEDGYHSQKSQRVNEWSYWRQIVLYMFHITNTQDLTQTRQATLALKPSFQIAQNDFGIKVVFE